MAQDGFRGWCAWSLAKGTVWGGIISGSGLPEFGVNCIVGDVVDVPVPMGDGRGCCETPSVDEGRESELLGVVVDGGCGWGGDGCSWKAENVGPGAGHGASLRVGTRGVGAEGPAAGA